MPDIADQAQACDSPRVVPIGVHVLHRKDLREQTYESRIRNVEAELLKQLDMQFSIDALPEDRLADVGLVGTTATKLALLLAKHFPFLTSPMTLIEQSATLADLIKKIVAKVGA